MTNALSAYGQRALVALSALLVTPYLFRHLGLEAFGTWSVMMTLTTVFAMLEEGFSLGTTKFVASHRAGGHRDEIERTLGASVMLMAWLGVIAAVACALIAAFAAGLAAPPDRDAFQAGMLILGGAFLLRIPLVSFGSVLAGYQRYDLLSLGQAVTIIGSALGSVAVVAAGGSVLGLAIVYAVAVLAGGVAYLLFLRRLDPLLRTRPLRADGSTRRKILGFSSFTMLADSMMFVGGRLDTVVIATIESASAAAPFAAATKLQNGIQALTLPVINLLLPMTSELEALGKRVAVAERLVLATRVTLQATIPVAAAMALFSNDVVQTWLGSSAPAVTNDIVTVLALNTLLLCAVPAHKVLIGMGRARTAGGLNTLEGLTNLTLSIFLVSAYGAIGAAIGTLSASLLVGPLNFPLASRATGAGMTRLIRDGLGRAVLSSLPGVAAMLPVWLLLSPGPLRLLAGLAAGIGIATAVAVAQAGPRRVVNEVRRGLRSARETDAPGSQLAAEGPL